MIGDLAKDGVEFPQAGHERQRFGLRRDQLSDLDALLRRGFPVHLAMDQLSLMRREHVHSLPSSSTARRRWRAVKSLDFTVLTGTPSASEISS